MVTVICIHSFIILAAHMTSYLWKKIFIDQIMLGWCVFRFLPNRSSKFANIWTINPSGEILFVEMLRCNQFTCFCCAFSAGIIWTGVPSLLLKWSTSCTVLACNIDSKACCEKYKNTWLVNKCRWCLYLFVFCCHYFFLYTSCSYY